MSHERDMGAGKPVVFPGLGLFLAVALAALAAAPARGQQADDGMRVRVMMSRGECSRLVPTINRLSPTYRPGLDAHGRPVLPAGGMAAVEGRQELPRDIGFDLVLDARSFVRPGLADALEVAPPRRALPDTAESRALVEQRTVLQDRERRLVAERRALAGDTTVLQQELEELTRRRARLNANQAALEERLAGERSAIRSAVPAGQQAGALSLAEQRLYFSEPYLELLRQLEENSAAQQRVRELLALARRDDGGEQADTLAANQGALEETRSRLRDIEEALDAIATTTRPAVSFYGLPVAVDGSTVARVSYRPASGMLTINGVSLEPPEILRLVELCQQAPP